MWCISSLAGIILLSTNVAVGAGDGVGNDNGSIGSRSFDPNRYTPGTAITVHIDIAYESEGSVTMEDVPPTGWIVSNISNDGTWNPSTGKINWGPWYYGEWYSGVSYRATPPLGETGTKTFDGTVSTDGLPSTIGGESNIDPVTGMLSISTIPVSGEVFVDGQRWGTAPQSSPISVGPHTVSFGSVDGYDTPADQEITVYAAEPAVITGIYVLQVDTLSIDTTPVKGEVFVDGQSWGIAPQAQLVLFGAHTVSFGDVSGYATPEPRQVDVTGDNPAETTGVYSQYTGMLSVTTTPVQADVFVDNVSWGTSPQTRTVTIGAHTVSFGNVAGYTTPAPQTTQVSVEETAIITGTYFLDKGTLSIDTSPIKAEVFVDGVSWGTAPEARELTIGMYIVTFAEVDGYITPAQQQVVVEADQTASAMGTYNAKTGTLSIDTAPIKAEVFVDGASWGTAPDAREVDIGTYTVTFAEVDGYITPAQQQVVVEADQTASAMGTYNVKTGTLSIDTAPIKAEVFVDGQSWGTAPQSKEMPVGTHTVSFGEVDGHSTPPNQQAEVAANQTTAVEGTYAPHTGRLVVDTTPIKAEVFVDGESWGTAPRERELPIGDYVVAFGDVDGYNTKPADQPVTISKDQTVEVTGGYRNRFKLVVVGGSGSGTYDANDVVPVLALLPDDARFDKWTGNTDPLADPNSPWTTIMLKDDTEITARYVKAYTLTINLTGPGKVIRLPLNQTRFKPGDRVDLLALPLGVGDRFLGWQGDTDPNDPNIAITIEMDGNKEVSAIFEDGAPIDAPPCAIPATIPTGLACVGVLLLTGSGRRTTRSRR